MDIEMFGQLLPEQADAPDSATTYGRAGPVTGTLPPLLSHQLIPKPDTPSKDRYLRMRRRADSGRIGASGAPRETKVLRDGKEEMTVKIKIKIRVEK